MFWNKLRGVWRISKFAVHSFWALLRVVILTRLGKLTLERGLELRRRWAEGTARVLNFKVTFEGDIPENEACLYVGNHRSSLDPIFVMARIKAFPVSRAEVRNWPIVGKGSDMTGIIFVDKSSRESRQATKVALLNEMRKGNSVLIFPEGRTNVEPLTATFQKGSFEQAAQGGFSVVPFVLEYKDKGQYWDHTDNFATHFLKEFGKRGVEIKVRFGPPIQSDNSWTLLRQAQAWIDENIPLVRAEWDGD